MATVNTHIDEEDGFKVLKYGLGSIVLIIGYPQSEIDLTYARDAIVEQLNHEISMKERRCGEGHSNRTVAVQESVVNIDQRPPQGSARIDVNQRSVRNPNGTPSDGDHAPGPGRGFQFIKKVFGIFRIA